MSALSKVTSEESMAAAKQCGPAIRTMLGYRKNGGDRSCRQITTLPTQQFRGAKSLSNGSFQLLTQGAEGLSIRVDTKTHPKLVFVVVATDEDEAKRDIENTFLLDAFEAAGLKVSQELREAAYRELQAQKRH